MVLLIINMSGYLYKCSSTGLKLYYTQCSYLLEIRNKKREREISRLCWFKQIFNTFCDILKILFDAGRTGLNWSKLL